MSRSRSQSQSQSSQSNIITLYDIPSREPRRCWSLNPWKTRLLLNFKRLAYTTEWVEYPDVQGLIEPHLPPNERGIPYTVPTIQLQLPDGDGGGGGSEWIMGSREIATRLDVLYPTPAFSSSISADPYLAEIEAVADRIAQTVSSDFIPKLARRVLGAASLPYWHRTREAWFGGLTLDEVAAQKGGARVYTAVAPLVARVRELLGRDASGPFIHGRSVSYADFVWVGVLRFFENLGDEELAMLIGADRACHVALLEACRPWLEREDH
ncbi:hypothetical protein PV04_09396 [Phialophora macrospora]|uniref:Uncharacterized protein n=1 Tax=Phialophora macrospora TaxID=1851006 RepID=A0A0D2FWZ8_9EURO|nr:hypothetical protein PV04_09396 [Phialophora macrospora]